MPHITYLTRDIADDVFHSKSNSTMASVQDLDMTKKGIQTLLSFHVPFHLPFQQFLPFSHTPLYQMSPTS